MEPEILQKLIEQEKKLDAVYASVEKMRKYFFWTLMVTVATIALPLLAMVFVIPWFLDTMSKAYGF